jgi:hypothetical protein
MLPLTRATFSFAVVLITLSARSFAETPPGASMSIVGVSGPGCRPGTTAYDLSLDKKAFTLMFDDYVVDSSETQSRYQTKHCNVQLRVQVPKGWSFGLFGLDVRGYAYLDSQVQGYQESMFQIRPGAPLMTFDKLELQGPYDNNYQRTTALALDQILWSSCSNGAAFPLNIQTSIGVMRARLPEYNKSHVRQQSGHLHAAAAGMFGKAISVFGSSHGVTQAIARLRDGALELQRVNERRSMAAIQQAFQVLVQHMDIIRDQGATHAAFSNDRHIQRMLQNMTNSRRELTRLIAGTNSNGHGLMSVDTMDGYVKQKFAIAWSRCNTSSSQGRWIQANATPCENVCRQHSLRSGVSSDGARCTSGEARPRSAVGTISYTHGCWKDCTPWIGMVPSQSVGAHCYAEGQTRDADRTDLTVGCFCE